VKGEGKNGSQVSLNQGRPSVFGEENKMRRGTALLSQSLSLQLPRFERGSRGPEGCSAIDTLW